MDEVGKLMRDTKHIRNMAIVAHVDHGKTTLSDSLLAVAGLISRELAGEQRVLDYDPQDAVYSGGCSSDPNAVCTRPCMFGVVMGTNNNSGGANNNNLVSPTKLSLEARPFIPNSALTA